MLRVVEMGASKAQEGLVDFEISYGRPNSDLACGSLSRIMPNDIDSLFSIALVVFGALLVCGWCASARSDRPARGAKQNVNPPMTPNCGVCQGYG